MEGGVEQEGYSGGWCRTGGYSGGRCDSWTV